MPQSADILQRIADGRTDLVLDWLEAGGAATATTPDGVLLLQWCAYYGDVTALRVLLERGETLATLGDDRGLRGAAFHGHWRLCEFLVEQGSLVDAADPQTGETPLLSALCNAERPARDHVVQVLLNAGADPNHPTIPGVETGCFMRDARTRGETSLHRAAAFGGEDTIDLLLAAGAKREVRDHHGDSPLAWGSWYGRPDAILRRLCYDQFTIHPQRRPLTIALLGKPKPQP